MFDGSSVEFFRSDAAAARHYQRLANDHKLARRLDQLGCHMYETARPVTLVDLATEGSIAEPRGRELATWRLFETQAASIAVRFTRELRTFVSVTDTVNASGTETLAVAGNVCAISIRPGRLADSKGDNILDGGLVPVGRCREAHLRFSAAFGSSLAYMQTRRWLVPIALGRHARPVRRGASVDLHYHLTAIVDPQHINTLHQYLIKAFGRHRVWVSAIEQPGVARDLFSTAAYPAWRLANQGYLASR